MKHLLLFTLIFSASESYSSWHKLNGQKISDMSASVDREPTPLSPRKTPPNNPENHCIVPDWSDFSSGGPISPPSENQ